jgi:predicted SprT family Zn-dependent metalloprotease
VRGMAASTVEQLTSELERALVHELMRSCRVINARYFKDKLRPAALELSDATSRLGQYSATTRTIAMSRALCVEQTWGIVEEVLKHELAHQYVYEVLGVADETAHGPAFQRLCQSLGIDASAAGMPVATGSDESDETRVLGRVAKLLALAESSNLHEAQAAMSAAQRLMLKHNLDAVRAGARATYGFRHVGKPTGRVTESERILGGILGAHFFVETIWVSVYRPLEQKRGSVLEVSGTAANLEMAAYVHSFLTHTSEQLWTTHKRARAIRGDKDRRTFLAGVMSGFSDKLRTARTEHQKEGLVWVNDADLSDYYRRRHPRIQSVRYAGNARTEAHAHGREAGRRIVLHRPIEAGATQGGRVLPPKR